MEYSILIVDDDKKIRDGLTHHIDWKALGYHRPLQASSGQEALEILKYQVINVLITDIRMPAMSGLELAAKVTASYPHTGIVILSGFSDFEYAKIAMKYGVRHYLTKPTDLDQFSHVMTEIKEEMDIHKKKTEIAKSMERKYNTAVQMLIEQFFIDLSHGALNSLTAINNFMKEYDIRFQFPYYTLIAVQILNNEQGEAKKWNYDSNQFFTMLKNILNITLNEFNFIYYTFPEHSNSIHILLNFEDTGDLSHMLSKLYENYKNLGWEKTLIAACSSVTSLELISLCYQQLQETLTWGRAKNLQGILHFRESAFKNTTEALYPDEKEKLLLSYMSNLDAEKTLNIIDRIFDPLKENNAHIELYRKYFVKLFFTIASNLTYFNVDMKEISGERMFPLKKAQEFRDSRELVSYLKSLALKIIEHLNDIKLPYSYKLVEKIKEYIENSYMNDITLYTASEAIHFSPTYISKIFKKVTGYNFIEYLSIVRMNRAKLLLSDGNVKIYEVGSLVGYKSIKHFSQVFKHHTGMAPSDFRESIKMSKDVKCL